MTGADSIATHRILGRTLAIWMCQAAILYMFAMQGAYAQANSANLASYVEGLDLLSAGRWPDAARAFEAAAQRMANDPRPVFARAVALTLDGRFAEASTAFDRAQRSGYRGREPRLWGYIIGRMATRAAGGGTFLGAPGSILQGDDDYPGDYAGFLYYGMATPYGETLARGGNVNAPQIRQALLDGARWFANRARTAPDLGSAMYERASAKQRANDFVGALEQLTFVRASYPVDPGAATLAADCWVGLWRNATARREATLALTQDFKRADALLRRAASSARLGRSQRALADLELASRYDPAQAKPFMDGIRAIAVRVVKPASPHDFLPLLEQRAAQGASDDELLKLAVGVYEAVLRSRRYYDEFYSDRVRELGERIASSPNDPEPLAAFASFLIDESRSERRGETLEPGSPLVAYRWQGDEQRDLHRAIEVADRALALRRDHIGALMQRARALARLGDATAAEKIVDAVLQRAPGNPLALHMRAQFYIERANLMFVQAALLRTPRVSTSSYLETRSDGVYRVTSTSTIQPSQSDLYRAGNLEQQAQQLMQRATAAIDAALAATKGTLAGDIMLAEVRLARRDLRGAEEAARAAIKRDPKSLQAYDTLAEVYRMGLQRDAADNVRSTATNLVHTTAGWKLSIAWRALEARQVDAALRAIEEARQLDPADARVYALRGTAAHLQGKANEARTSWRVALALSSAAVAVDETPPQPRTAPLPRDPLEYGVAMAMRERLAVGAKPEEALRLARANASLARVLPPGGRRVQLFTAMLPDPDAPRIPVRVAENVAEFLARAHVAAARALSALQRSEEAMNEYRAAAQYALPPPSRSIPIIGDKRGRLQDSTLAFAAKGPELGGALIVLGRDAIRRRDLQAAQDYLAQAVATSISREQRAEVNQLQFEIARAHKG